MADNLFINLPRFVKVDYATYKAGTPVDNTLYFITDLGVIYQGSTLQTKGVQTDNTVKVPGLFYVLGEGKDAKLVTYASAEAEPTVIAISENAIDAKVKVATDAAAAAQSAAEAAQADADAIAKDLTDNYSNTAAVTGLINAAKEEIGGNIDDLTAADIAYTAVAEGVITGDNVQTAIEAIDAQLKEIVGGSGEGDEPQSIVALASRLVTAEGEIDTLQSVTEGYTEAGSIKTAIDSKVAIETGKELAATADIAKWNATSATVDALPEFGDIVTRNAAEFDAAGAAAGVQSAIEAKLGGNFGTEEGQQTVDAAIKAVDGKFANYSTSEQVDSKISTALSSVLKFKGVVADKAALDALTGMAEGDVYYVTADSKEFVYVAQEGKTGWEELGASVDYTGMLAPYLLIGDTFVDGQILVASVNGDDKSAKTTGLTVGGAALAAEPSETVLATEKAVKASVDAVDAKFGESFDSTNTVAAKFTSIEEVISSLEWKTTMA